MIDFGKWKYFRFSFDYNSFFLVQYWILTLKYFHCNRIANVLIFSNATHDSSCFSFFFLFDTDATNKQTNQKKSDYSLQKKLLSLTIILVWSFLSFFLHHFLWMQGGLLPLDLFIYFSFLFFSIFYFDYIFVKKSHHHQPDKLWLKHSLFFDIFNDSYLVFFFASKFHLTNDKPSSDRPIKF